jgi:hypothetical protein
MWPWEVPILIVTFWVWLQASPDSLVDASRREAWRRVFMPHSVRSLTNEDVERLAGRGTPTSESAAAPPDASSPGPSSAVPGSTQAQESNQELKKDEPRHDEAWWRSRTEKARETLERDQLLAESLQSRLNALTTDESARDDPAERRELASRRDRALVELRRMTEAIAADQKAMAAIEEEARQQGVPAGWVR